ncbi:hypothetical protein ABK040_006021 [Willaertia magna]
MEKHHKKASIKMESNISYQERKNQRSLQQLNNLKQKRKNLMESKRKKIISENLSEETILNSFEIENLILNLENSKNNYSSCLKLLQKIRNLLFLEKNINLFINNFNFLNLLNLIFLENLKYSEIILEICWIITNLATINSESLQNLFFFIPNLFKLLELPFLDNVLMEQIIWAFGNFSASINDKISISGMLIENGILFYLENILKINKNKNVLLTSIWCLQNLIKNEMLQNLQNLEKFKNFYEILFLLKDKIYCNEILICFTYLSHSEFSLNFLQNFLQLVQENNFCNLKLKILANLFFYKNILPFLDNSFFENQILNFENKNKEYFYLFSNISYYNENLQFLQNFFNLNFLPILDIEPKTLQEKEKLRECCICFIHFLNLNFTKEIFYKIKNIVIYFNQLENKDHLDLEFIHFTEPILNLNF